jgi:hypothetical protein
VTSFSPRFFLTIVVQNVPLYGKLKDAIGIFRSRKSNDKQHNDQKIPKELSETVNRMINKNGTFCTTTIVRKKRGENDLTSCDVTSGYDITSGHITDVTSGYGVTSSHVTDVTSGSTEQQQQYSQSNNEEPYYILKTNNPFLFWEPLYCNVFYVI